MVKEFEINDILNAVNNISKIEKKRSKTVKKKNSTSKNFIQIKILHFLNDHELYVVLQCRGMHRSIM